VITRPLDLLSKLRPRPRNYDFLFLVNGGLIALFFTLFGSQFVLSPGLRINNTDIRLPTSPSALDGATATRVSISVNANGQIWGDTGLIAPARLQEWMRAQAKRAPGTVLLVIVDKDATAGVLANISEAATAAGFGVQQALEQSAPFGTTVAP
jgi:biopolymer transport protein ExbD